MMCDIKALPERQDAPVTPFFLAASLFYFMLADHIGSIKKRSV